MKKMQQTSDLFYHQVFNKFIHNFDADEFACPCKDIECQRHGMSLDFVLYLQHVRMSSDIPFKITSGYRCLAYNAKIGGTARSKHTLGIAADISVEDLDVSEKKMIFLILSSAFSGVGLYDKHIHVDTREHENFWLGVSK